MTDRFRSPLSKARGLGSAHHGVSHWLVQRITAVAMIPLSMWFVTSLICGLLSGEPAKVAAWLASPVHAILLAVFIVAMLTHAKLGFQVVVEDYVKCTVAKYGLLLLNIFLASGLIAIALFAIAKLHLFNAI